MIAVNDKPSHKPIAKWHGLFLFLLFLIVIILAIKVVHISSQVRDAQGELYQLSMELNSEKEKWGALMLQKTHLETPAEVEKQAQKLLGMTAIPQSYIQIKLLPSNLLPTNNTAQPIQALSPESTSQELGNE